MKKLAPGTPIRGPRGYEKPDGFCLARDSNLGVGNGGWRSTQPQAN